MSKMQQKFYCKVGQLVIEGIQMIGLAALYTIPMVYAIMK